MKRMFAANKPTCDEGHLANPLKVLALCLTLLSLFLAGCAASTGVLVQTEETGAPYRKNELDKLVGETMEEVRQRFGDPVVEFTLSDRSYFLYETYYDSGGIVFVGLLPFGLPIPASAEKRHRHCTLLEFGSDRLLIQFKTSGETVVADVSTAFNWTTWGRYSRCLSEDELKAVARAYTRMQAEKRMARALQRAEERKALVAELEHRAELGEPEALYDYAFEIWPAQPARAMPLFCKAAHRGLAKAQKLMGDSYRHGSAPLTKNLIQAYLWYTMAAEQGFQGAAKLQTSTRDSMSPDQVVEAKRLVAKWQPDPTECELEAAQKDH